MFDVNVNMYVFIHQESYHIRLTIVNLVNSSNFNRLFWFPSRLYPSLDAFSPISAAIVASSILSSSNAFNSRLYS